MKTNQNTTDSEMVTCQELEAFIDDYLDDTLPTEQHAIFVSHLEKCPPCDHYLKNYRNTVSLGKAAYKDQSACEEIPESLVNAILSASKKPK